MINGKLPLLLIAVLVCLTAPGCSGLKETGRTLGNLVEVRGEIIKKFGEEGVNVNVNSMGGQTSMIVTFVNSPLNSKSSEERELRALETAKIVTTHYRDISSVKHIYVSFMRADTKLVIFHSNRTVDFYSFDSEGKLIKDSQSDPSAGIETELKASPHYRLESNQTSISTQFRLEGVTGLEVMMYSQFLVPGDTAKQTPKAPRMVLFDIASFSRKPKFPGELSVVFTGDDKTFFETKKEFSSSTVGGEAREILHFEVPYAKFRQMVSAKTLTMSLGDQKFELTDQQLGALKGMTKFVKD